MTKKSTYSDFVAICEKVARESQAARFTFEGRRILIDGMTANLVSQVHSALNETNRQKVAAIFEAHGPRRVVDIFWKAAKA